MKMGQSGSHILFSINQSRLITTILLILLYYDRLIMILYVRLELFVWLITFICNHRQFYYFTALLHNFIGIAWNFLNLLANRITQRTSSSSSSCHRQNCGNKLKLYFRLRKINFSIQKMIFHTSLLYKLLI